LTDGHLSGTTAKAALVEAGQVSSAAEFQVGGGIMSGSRLLTGAGYPLRVPAIDLAEVGAGGSSVVWLDPAGAPPGGAAQRGCHAGPRLLSHRWGRAHDHRLQPRAGLAGHRRAGGWHGQALDAEAARASLAYRIAGPLGLRVEAAAYGAVESATATMIRAIRVVSSERGRDPRDFTLVAFGGNGGIFGPLIARTLGIGRVVISPAPGLFSAVGLIEEYDATLVIPPGCRASLGEGGSVLVEVTPGG
jgi:N-methylhydantoinase A